MDVGHRRAQHRAAALPPQRRRTIATGVAQETIAEMAAKPRRRLAVSTAIFAIATALSRVAGLLREIVAASFFGTTAAASAFTFASQIPNLMASLFAQAALSSAFVPVFTGLLQEGRKREAVRLASTLFWLVLIGLGALIAIAMLLVGAVMPMFTSSHFDGSLAAALTEIMFPTVLAMALMGLLAGILQSYDEFSIPAAAPVAWNAVILALLIGLHHTFHPSIYAYAVAWLVATVVQLAIVGSALRRIDFRLRLELDWRDPRVRQVFTLMLPVTIGLGILNLDQLINSSFGALVSPQGPRAIQFAFLVYMLPQGVFSVAVSTVLFPTLSRQAARRAAAEMRRPPDGVGDPDHALGLPAWGVQRHLNPPHLDGALLLRLEPALLRAEPALDAHLLRRAPPVDPNQARSGQHHARCDSERAPLQAARDRRAGDRDGGRQRAHDLPAGRTHPRWTAWNRRPPNADDLGSRRPRLGAHRRSRPRGMGRLDGAARRLHHRPAGLRWAGGGGCGRVLLQARAGAARAGGAPDRAARAPAPGDPRSRLRFPAATGASRPASAARPACARRLCALARCARSP